VAKINGRNKGKKEEENKLLKENGRNIKWSQA
jgi:hypothetical protein